MTTLGRAEPARARLFVHPGDSPIRILANSAEIDRTLRDLLKRYPRYSWALAWASQGFPACDLLLRNTGRIERLVVGTHFYQTDPDLIARLLEHPRTRFVLNPSGVFHPKIYLFEGKNRWECVIGSPNFTYGGLGGNDEVATLLSDADQGAADAYRAVKAVIEQYWQRGSVMSAADLEGYRQMWSARLRVRAQLGDTSRTGAKPTGDGGRSPLEIPILRLPWSEFVSRARAEDTGHSIVGRLAVLDHVRTQFKGGTSFCDIDTVWRKRIAGTTYERFDEAGDDPNWLWFGSMRGAGTFKSLVADNSSHLSDALDAIPSAGEVSREQYELFVHRFTKAFAGRPGGGPGIGTASRLLAMKRPDYFVCLDSKNRAGLRKAFGIRGACGLAEYWDSIVERIRSAAWWLADAPTAGEDAEIWKGRAAMLDALYYEG